MTLVTEETRLERRKQYIKNYAKKYYELHKDELAEYKQKWDSEHKEQVNVRKRKWAEANNVYLKRNPEAKKLWELKNKEKRAKAKREWSQKNRERHNAAKRRWAQNKDNKEKKKKYETDLYYYLKNEVLTHYGGDPPKCNCCGESNKMFLTLDHINGGGKQEVWGKHAGNHRSFLKSIVVRNFPPLYQILCHNCNSGRARNKGVCPHKSEVLDILGLNVDLSTSSASASCTSSSPSSG